MDEMDEGKKENTLAETVKQTKTQLLMEIFRFLLVGGVATIADYAVQTIANLIMTKCFHIDIETTFWTPLISKACGFPTGMIVNWLLSILFVFQQVKDKKQTRSQKSFWMFALISVIGFVATLVGVSCLTWALPTIQIFGKTSIFGTTWSEWIATIVMTCVVLVWNYLGRKIFIFKS